MGVDATTKIPPETQHEWGAALVDPDVAAMVKTSWAEYGLADCRLGGLIQICFGYDKIE